MTIQQLSYICGAVYFNPPRALLPKLYAGQTTLGMHCAILLEEDREGRSECGPMRECSKTILRAVVDDAELCALPIKAYENLNATTGFVGYAFESAKDGVIAAFRGSERKGQCVPGNIDWHDNFEAPFEGSVQYPDVERFVNRYRTGKLLLAGHSKGAHNAMYALTVARNERARCVAFDGQGFAAGQFTAPLKRRLALSAINYVAENDVVGVLLSHPERRVFVKKQGELNPHELCSLMFDAHGDPIPGKRPLWSYLLEGATAIYVDDYVRLEGSRMPHWLEQLVGILWGRRSAADQASPL